MHFFPVPHLNSRTCTHFSFFFFNTESPIEEVTDALYDKGVGFMMTHDVELKLPDMLFDGAVLKISPRSLEGSGALVHLDLQPRTEVNENGQGRIFFKKISKCNIYMHECMYCISRDRSSARRRTIDNDDNGVLPNKLFLHVLLAMFAFYLT